MGKVTATPNCPQCGPVTRMDSDGTCGYCGADIVSGTVCLGIKVAALRAIEAADDALKIAMLSHSGQGLVDVIMRWQVSRGENGTSRARRTLRYLALTKSVYWEADGDV